MKNYVYSTYHLKQLNFYKVKINVTCVSKKLDITVRCNSDESENAQEASDLIWCYLAPIAFNALDIFRRDWPGLFYKVGNFFLVKIK